MASETASGENGLSRDRIASNVVFWAGIGILIVSVTVLVVNVTPLFLKTAPDKEVFGEATKVSQQVFNTLIPLFGTWVGTVLAFYFSRENYAAAAKSTRELVGQLGDDRLKQIPVKDVWIPVNAIAAVNVQPGQEATIDFKAKVEGLLSSQVSRVPVWNSNKVVRYVIHESMVYKFLAKQATLPAPTLSNFLAFSDNGSTMESIVTKIGWVAQTATLADAKANTQSLKL